VSGPQRSPEGATFVSGVPEVTQRADRVVLSLPDGAVSEQVTAELAAVDGRSTTHVIDTSTIGPRFARSRSERLSQADIAYIDAPVSGGVAGARARTLTVMYAGSDQACARVEPVLAGLTDRRHRVGEAPGMAQALKLANNFLSATALLATSEAIAFGLSVGLDMAKMIEVLNDSSGHNTATEDKFPNHVLTEKFSSGFANSLMNKDMQLYLRAVEEEGGPALIGTLTASVWQNFAAAEPGVDFTRIFPFIENGKAAG
jgi:3-hydroxyisobutyrate dehydrogenase